MNPTTLHEHLEQHLQGMYVSRKENPQEGDVVNDIHGTNVYLDGAWHLVDYSQPDKVQALREQWFAMSERKRLANRLHEETEMLNRARERRAKHRGMDIGSASGGVHMHDDGKEKPTVHILSEEELDSQTFDAFNEGVQHAYDTLLEELLAEEQELKRYGRTDVYGVHKAIALIKQKSNKGDDNGLE